MMLAPNRSKNAADFLRFLKEEGILTTEAAQRASLGVSGSGQALDLVLTELGLAREEDIVSHLARYLDVVAVDLSAIMLDETLLASVGHDFLRQNAILPIAADNERITLAVADPFAEDAIASVGFHLDRKPDLRLSARTEITTLLATSMAAPEVDERPEPDDGAGSVEDVERLRDVAREAPVVRFVTQMIQKAVERGATDIHVEPLEDTIRVRYRRDGLLAVADSAPRSLHAAIITRIKIQARLNIAERRLPQDGRMRLAHRGQNVDLRVATTPGLHGETVVLRILDKSATQLTLPALGFDDEACDDLRRLSGAPNGLLLVTGPTGSGKTTTLYAILNQLNLPEVKIFTVEDPIEYRLAGVTQLQVDPAIGFDFGKALRSVLRLDPDIILIGEIRDRETAEIAVRAALTGHLVFATLHTNSAAGALTRLVDMGIDGYLLGATIRGIIGQRLLRKSCTSCGGNSGQPGVSICARCGGTGYAGRMVTYEILPLSPRISTMIVDRASEEQLHRVACEEGMVPLGTHAHSLVRLGLTSEAEMLRVVQLGGG